MQAVDIRKTSTPSISDTYVTAFRLAEDALRSAPVLDLARMEALSYESASMLRDSSERLYDVRRICRKAVIDATRNHLRAQIDGVIAELDELRRHGMASDRREGDAALLESAICAGKNARVNLDASPFLITLRYLEAARAVSQSF